MAPRGYSSDGRKTQDHWSYRMLRPAAAATAMIIYAIVIIPIKLVDLYHYYKEHHENRRNHR